MSDDLVESIERVLEPIEPSERIAETLFGLIMVLALTASLKVATAGRDDLRTMFISALGCNLAGESLMRCSMPWAAWPRRAESSQFERERFRFSSP
jgi:hypothetical protein